MLLLLDEGVGLYTTLGVAATELGRLSVVVRFHLFVTCLSSPVAMSVDPVRRSPPAALSVAIASREWVSLSGELRWRRGHRRAA